MTTSEQARADAMADAETLRRNLRVQPAGWKVAGWTRVRINSAANDIRDAEVRDLSPQAVTVAARAAFSAVPALRGDR